MTKYHQLIMGFYLAALIIAILSGFRFGFDGVHGPSVPFLVEVLIIVMGLIWLMVDTILVSAKRTQTWRDIMPHVIGIIINVSFVVYLIYPFF